MQTRPPTITADQMRERAAVVDKIYAALPAGINVYNALDALLSAYVTAGARTNQMPAIKAGLRTTLAALDAGDLETRKTVPIDVAQEETQLAADLVRSLQAAIPKGIPHMVSLAALLNLFRHLAATHSCCIAESARMAQTVATELQAIADRASRTTH